jgi:hypothetical protein
VIHDGARNNNRTKRGEVAGCGRKECPPSRLGCSYERIVAVCNTDARMFDKRQ